jgi:hypothetical protein
LSITIGCMVQHCTQVTCVPQQQQRHCWSLEVPPPPNSKASTAWFTHLQQNKIIKFLPTLTTPPQARTMKHSHTPHSYPIHITPSTYSNSLQHSCRLTIHAHTLFSVFFHLAHPTKHFHSCHIVWGSSHHTQHLKPRPTALMYTHNT